MQSEGKTFFLSSGNTRGLYLWARCSSREAVYRKLSILTVSSRCGDSATGNPPAGGPESAEQAALVSGQLSLRLPGGLGGRQECALSP